MNGQRLTVVYARGGDQIELLTTIGRSHFTEINAFGVLERVTCRDYSVTANDLVLSGSQTTPERGDLITEEADGLRHTYEVVAPSGKPHWRWTDPYHRTYRIHTKKINTTAIMREENEG